MVELLADPADCGFAATHKSDHHNPHETAVPPGHEEEWKEKEEHEGSEEPGISIRLVVDSVALHLSPRVCVCVAEFII